MDQEAYFDAQKSVSTVINNAKTEYYTEKLSGCDSKCMFKDVNELLNKNNHSLPDCNSCEDLADQFCDFFNNKIDRIREVVDSANLGENLSSYISSNHSNCSM